MEYVFKNKTESVQQIMLIDGGCKTVYPGESISLDHWEIYKEEFERVKKFFEISKKDDSEDKEPLKTSKPKKKSPVRRRSRKIQSESNNDMTEVS